MSCAAPSADPSCLAGALYTLAWALPAPQLPASSLLTVTKRSTCRRERGQRALAAGHLPIHAAGAAEPPAGPAGPDRWGAASPARAAVRHKPDAAGCTSDVRARMLAHVRCLRQPGLPAAVPSPLAIVPAATLLLRCLLCGSVPACSGRPGCRRCHAPGRQHAAAANRG